MSSTGSRTGSSASDPITALFDNRRGMESALAFTNSMLKGWETIGEAWMGCVRSQIDSNLALAQSLAKCDNPLTALSLQLDGAQATLSRCMTAATKTSDVASKIAAEALAHAQPPQRAA
jgi:hypothetical protein